MSDLSPTQIFFAGTAAVSMLAGLSLSCFRSAARRSSVVSVKLPIQKSDRELHLPGSRDVLPYTPPLWASHLSPQPWTRLSLGVFPTPIVPLALPGLPEGVKLYCKRDDLSGLELSGNKVRKLEFLMAEAVQQHCDCVITIGGIQSNHARATACAARMLGLESHLILRVGDKNVDPDELFAGNLLFNRMVDANLWLVSREEYFRIGSTQLVKMLEEKLRACGHNPYPIPVGGSSWLGTWGYIEAIRELQLQLSELDLPIDDIAFATGSGGTMAGVALGTHLAKNTGHSHLPDTRVHAFAVCDTPEEFYRVLKEDIFGHSNVIEKVETLVEITDAKGKGYAVSTQEELAFLRDVSRKTGLVLDPVYSGKALKALVEKIQANPEAFAPLPGRTRNVLFLHTGGVFGLYDKIGELAPLLPREKVQKLL